MISQVAIAMMWRAIYNAEYGIINQALERIGAAHLTRNWLGEIATAFPAILAQEVLYIGYFMIIILAYTMAIPESYYDAAQLDGANVLQQERYITLPVTKPILITTMTLATAFALRHFITLIRTTIGRRDAASDSSQ